MAEYRASTVMSLRLLSPEKIPALAILLTPVRKTKRSQGSSGLKAP